MFESIYPSLEGLPHDSGYDFGQIVRVYMDARIPRQNHLGLLDDPVGMPQTAKFQSTSRPGASHVYG